MKNLYGLIMAGGSGTRLWPISRDYYPKQFLKLIGDETLLQQTFTRLKKIIPAKNIYITTNRIFADEIVSQLKKYGFKNDNIVIQPENKDTGPAIGQAINKIYKINKNAIVVTCPSDHRISPDSGFISATKSAIKLANKNYLVTFGINPDFPSSEYGYIAIESKKTVDLKNHKSFKVKKFIEKPDTTTAKQLIKEGSLWNSGIFIWRAKKLLDELKKHKNDFYKALNTRRKYFLLDPLSIDKSVLEKSDAVWVIPVNFEWKDIGSWKALYDLLPKDDNNNVLNSRVIASNTNGSLIYGAEGRVVTAIHLDDLIVVDTHDSVLVAKKDSVHEIKNALKEMENVNLIENLKKPLLSIIIPLQHEYKFIDNAFQSIIDQKYKNVEIIVVDGDTNPKTKRTIQKFKHRIEHYSILKNSTRFEKMNKGIIKSQGEIIGILEPDNLIADSDILETVVFQMQKKNSHVVWGDLVYVTPNDIQKIKMYWKSSPPKQKKISATWTPPHQTLFVKKEAYKKYGIFNTEYSVAAEYELMLRFLNKHKVKGHYIPKILVKMIGRGITTENILNRLKGNIETYKAWKQHGFAKSPTFLISKNISKVPQVWKRDSDVIVKSA